MQSVPVKMPPSTERETPDRQSAEAFWRSLLTLAVAIAAIAALIVGLLLPSIAFQRLFVFNETHSLSNAVIALWMNGERWLAGVLCLFSVIFPALKLAVLLIASLRRVLGQRDIPALLHLAARLGRWSMLDVFVVALVVFTIKGSGLADAMTLPGIWVFTLAVILSIWASERLGVKPAG